MLEIEKFSSRHFNTNVPLQIIPQEEVQFQEA